MLSLRRFLPAGILAVFACLAGSPAARADDVYAWGRNADGQLGLGDTTIRLSPIISPNLFRTDMLATGNLHSLALSLDGTLRAWGDNDYGQLGDGTTTASTTPMVVSSLTNATYLTAGRVHSLALLANGTVRAWGYNVYGQLGDGTTTQRTTPVAVSSLVMQSRSRGRVSQPRDFGRRHRAGVGEE